MLWSARGHQCRPRSTPRRPRRSSQESLTLFVEFGDRWFCGIVLESAAFLAGATGDAERAVRLLGAADAIWRRIEVPLPALFRDAPRPRARRGAQPSGRGRLRGGVGRRQAVPLGATVELVAPGRARERRRRCRRGSDPPRDRGARAGRQGLTDAEVAEQLVVSIRTVHAHLRSIYRKLDVHTRSAATRYALEQASLPRSASLEVRQRGSAVLPMWRRLRLRTVRTWRSATERRRLWTPLSFQRQRLFVQRARALGCSFGGHHAGPHADGHRQRAEPRLLSTNRCRDTVLDASPT